MRGRWAWVGGCGGSGCGAGGCGACRCGACRCGAGGCGSSLAVPAILAVVAVSSPPACGIANHDSNPDVPPRNTRRGMCDLFPDAAHCNAAASFTRTHARTLQVHGTCQFGDRHFGTLTTRTVSTLLHRLPRTAGRPRRRLGVPCRTESNRTPLRMTHPSALSDTPLLRGIVS